MILKIFKAVWFFSVLVLFGVFFYVYASLPETVVFSDKEEIFSVSRNGFFYLFIFIYGLLNALVFFINKLIVTQLKGFYGWFIGLVITLNVFFIAILAYLFVVNGQDNYKFEKLGPALFGSTVLVVAWLVSWPLYTLFQKIIKK